MMKNSVTSNSLQLSLKLIGIFLLTYKSLIAQTPNTFNHNITFGGQTITVNFTKYSIRDGNNFQVLVQQAGGAFANQTVNHTDVRTYIGTVQGIPGAFAGAILRDGGRAIQANVIFENGYQWFDQGGTVTDFMADTLVERLFPTFQLRSGGAGTTLYGASTGVDITNGMIALSGGSVAAAVEMAEFSMLVCNLPFIKGASAVNRIARLVIRANAASDPYTAENIDPLTFFPQPITEDLICLGSEHVGTPTAFSGLGNMGISLNNPDPANGDFGGTARHEIGHNWGMGHQDGGFPEGKTISSGNELGKFSAPALENIMRVRDENLGILDNLGTFAIPIPPRAADDIYFYEPGTGGNIVMNVLDNDRDVNGSAITILHFDAQTQNGRTVTQNGNQLLIATPSEFTTLPDNFSYRIQDVTGMTSTAFVHIKANVPNDDIAHWTFENSQNRVLDSGSDANHGQLYDNASINTNGELVLDGVRDFAAMRPEGITTNTITYSAWIFSTEEQIAEAGIIVGDSYGLEISDDNRLSYIWNDIGFDSDLTLPNNVWTFVSLVVSATEGTIYMQPTGNSLQTWTNTMNHTAEDMRFFLYLGSGRLPDPDAEPPFLPYFNGRMDDVRIKNSTLNATQINALANRGLGARDPNPFHSAARNSGTVHLSWTPSPQASGQKLFLSTDYNEVKNGAAAAEQSGINATTNTLALNNLNGSYFWRVETTEPTGTDPGCIWNFTARATNHAGTCVAVKTVCNGVGEVTGLTSAGTDIFSVGTVGALEANFEFVQRNTPACGPPVQCDTPGDKGNRSPGGIAFHNGNVFVASGNVYAMSHNSATACTAVWTAPIMEATGLTLLNDQLFVAANTEIEELNPTTGENINGWTGIGKVERLCPGPNGTLYFTNHQLSPTGGVGVFNPTTGIATMLPAPAGTTLHRASGLTVDSLGNIIVAERGKRRVLSINPTTGEMSTLVDGFIDPTDVIFIGDTLYISDKGANEIQKIYNCASNICPHDVVVNSNSTGNQQASNTIITNGTVNVTGNIIYQAGTSITLNPGFTVSTGSTFTAKIDVCTNTLVGEDLELRQADAPTPISSTMRPQLTEPLVFPNPFSQSFSIEYEVEVPSKVYIHVFDLRGRLIAESLNNPHQVAGFNTLTIPSASWIDGMYLVRIQVGDKVWTKRVVKQL